MERRSLAEGKRDGILRAFARCVKRDGAGSVTLQDVADEARGPLSLIHREFSSREDLVWSALDRMTQVAHDDFSAAMDSVPNDERLRAQVDHLFNPSRRHAESLIDALRSTSDDDEFVNDALLRVYQRFTAMFSESLIEHFPAVSRNRCREVAFSIQCLAASSSRFAALGFAANDLSAAHKSAGVLLESLAIESSESASRAAPGKNDS